MTEPQITELDWQPYGIFYQQKPDFLIVVNMGISNPNEWKLSISGDGVVKLPDGMTAEEALLVVAYACGGGFHIPDADLSPALKAIVDKWFTFPETCHD
jgi:hypothetical protein